MKKKSPDICLATCSNEQKRAVLKRLFADGPESSAIGYSFSLLSDERRVRILIALERARELCVCDIATGLGVTVALASHHLRRLKDAEILETRCDGKLVYYSIKKTAKSQALRDCLWKLHGLGAHKHQIKPQKPASLPINAY